MFILNKFKKLAQEKMISGQPVADLIRTIINMFGRGAPTIEDAIGFNKTDYSNPVLNRLGYLAPDPNTEIPISEAVIAINALAKYKNTQLPNYDSLYKSLVDLINQSTSTVQKATVRPQENLTDAVEQNKIIYKGINKWGSHVYFIPGLGRKYNKILKKVEQEIVNKGQDIEAWKVFYRDKRSGVDIYTIRPAYISFVSQLLSEIGYDTSEMSVEDIETKPYDLENVSYENSNLKVVLGRFDKEWNNFIRELKSKGIKVGYDPNDHGRIFYNIDYSTYQLLLAHLRDDNKYKTEKVETFEDQIKQKEEQEAQKVETRKDKGIRIRVRNVMQNTEGHWHLAFGFFKSGTEEGERLKETIKFMFPSYGPEGQRFVAVVPDLSNPHDPSKDEPNKPGYKQYLVRGDYNQYRKLSEVMSRLGFDTSELNRIVAQLISDGNINVTRVEGDLEGFQKEKEFTDAAGNSRVTKVNDYEAFNKELDKYDRTIEKDDKKAEFKLYDLQRQGVAFLYGRQSALLGDSTGTGKTIQTIIAADMRMRQQGGKTLIITQTRDLQPQWAREIKKIALHNPDDISLDPYFSATWNILTYIDFQVKGSRDEITRILKSRVSDNEYTCCILDEVHNVKNTGAARTENIKSITSFEDEYGETHKIPFVWGASATVVANKPIDLYNQLKAINHPLGDLSYGVFAREFGGMSRGTYGLEEGDKITQAEAANRLKRWLINFDVYIARTKKQLREDMPDLNINEKYVDIDSRSFLGCISEKLKEYKDPELAISIMIATRECLSRHKVDSALEEAEKVLRSGKKIMVFTAFKEPAREMMIGMQRILDESGSGGRVVSIIGGMHKKTRAKNIEDFRDPNSDAKAMVLMIQAGGTGLDFPNIVEDVIELDRDWTPASVEQMRGRAWRISSEKPVNVISLVAKNTPDEDFNDRIKDKIKIADVIKQLTSKQLELFNRKDNYTNPQVQDTIEEVNQELVENVGKLSELEDTDTNFMQQEANNIMDAIRDSNKSSLGYMNWYKRAGG